jgi:hypothetical protein
MKKTTVGVVLAAVLGLVGLGALIAYDGESTEEAKASFCESLTELESTVKGYESLDLRTATNDELDAAADDIYAAWDDVVDEGWDWVYAEDNTLTDAYNDLYYAIDDLPGDSTVSESLADLEDELAAFPAAYEETFDGTGCATV